jgi:hypothetical protein
MDKSKNKSELRIRDGLYKDKSSIETNDNKAIKDLTLNEMKTNQEFTGIRNDIMLNFLEKMNTTY